MSLMHLHLLEPYRSAIIAKCLEESFIESIPPEAAVQSPGMRTCGTPELIAEALQLAVLGSETSMVWTEVGSVAKEKGMAYMKLSGLENLGLVNLVSEFPADVLAAEKSRWKGLKNVDELWMLEQDEIESLWPLLSAQLEARGKPVHWSLYRLLRAFRLGQEKAVPIIMSTVPPSLREVADSILKLEPRLYHEIELPIIMELQHLRLTSTTAMQSGARIVGATPVSQSPQVQLGKSTRQLWGLVVEELIGEQIKFPVPQSMRDVVLLRDRAEIVDFRNFLIPFLDAVVAGEPNTVEDLRRSIKGCLKAFNRYPVTQRLARWTSYAGLTVDVIEAFSHLVGFGIGVGIIGLGLEGLAHRWKSQSSWLYMARSSS